MSSRSSYLQAEVDYMMGLSEWLIGDNIDKLSRSSSSAKKNLQ